MKTTKELIALSFVFCWSIVLKQNSLGEELLNLTFEDEVIGTSPSQSVYFIDDINNLGIQPSREQQTTVVSSSAEDGQSLLLSESTNGESVSGSGFSLEHEASETSYYAFDVWLEDLGRLSVYTGNSSLVITKTLLSFASDPGREHASIKISLTKASQRIEILELPPAQGHAVMVWVDGELVIRTSIGEPNEYGTTFSSSIDFVGSIVDPSRSPPNYIPGPGIIPPDPPERIGRVEVDNIVVDINTPSKLSQLGNIADISIEEISRQVALLDFDNEIEGSPPSTNTGPSISIQGDNGLLINLSSSGTGLAIPLIHFSEESTDEPQLSHFQVNHEALSSYSIAFDCWLEGEGAAVVSIADHQIRLSIGEAHLNFDASSSDTTRGQLTKNPVSGTNRIEVINDLHSTSPSFIINVNGEEAWRSSASSSPSHETVRLTGFSDWRFYSGGAEIDNIVIKEQLQPTLIKVGEWIPAQKYTSDQWDKLPLLDRLAASTKESLNSMGDAWYYGVSGNYYFVADPFIYDLRNTTWIYTRPETSGVYYYDFSTSSWTWNSKNGNKKVEF